MKAKDIFILGGFILVLVLGAAYFFNDRRQDTASVEETVTSTAVIYRNTEYGFSIALPKSWEGYDAITEEWEGQSVSSDGGSQGKTEAGPLVSLRHPSWSEALPRQDIPVMVFTLMQWADMAAGKFHIGAAPIGPRELARNNAYVFALPARYNFAYLSGYEEVDAIVQSGAIKAF